MGFLTTFTIRNDGAYNIEKHPKEFALKIYRAIIQGSVSRRDYSLESLGSHANMIIVQNPRHADSHGLYLHAGNTVVDVDEITESNPVMLEHALKEINYQLKRLRAIKRELRELRSSKKNR